jgi:hypothetical protein
MRQYQLLDSLIEFKYLPLDAVGLTGAAVRDLSRTELATLPQVHIALTAAREKLRSYRQALETAHPGYLRLRTYCVLAIGFEKLVWDELLDEGS